MFIPAACLASVLLNAQDVNYAWGGGLTGSFADCYVYDVESDQAGNKYYAGDFYQVVDFDPGPGVYNLSAYAPSVDSPNMFVMKLDSDNQFVWAFDLGDSITIEYLHDIAVDDAGNIYVVGVLTYNCDMDPGPGVAMLNINNDHAFVAKYDSNGAYQWAIKISGNSTTTALSVDIAPSGDIVVGGHFAGTADFDPSATAYNLTANGSSDGFVAKYTSAGNLIWANKFGTLSVNQCRGVTADSSGNILYAGSFYGTCDFDPGAGVYNLTSAGQSDIVVSKLSPTGTLIWAQAIGGSQYDIGQPIQVGKNGSVYFGGIFSDTVDFDPGPGVSEQVCSGQSGWYVARFDSSGNFVWAYGSGAFGGDVTEDIALDTLGNVYAVGYFYGTTDFEPGPGVTNLTATGVSDGFIVKYDSAGNLGWTKHIGGSNSDLAYGVYVDDRRSVWVAGSFKSSADLDPGPSTATFTTTTVNRYGGYIIELDVCNVTVNDVISSCTPYTWIDGITYYSSNNTATVVFQGAAAGGCDSIIALDLTISLIDSSVTLIGATLTVAQAGAIYQWIDCADSSAIPGATSQSFSPSQNGNYSVAITLNGCMDTSACVSVLSTELRSLSENAVEVFPNPANDHIIIRSVSPGTQMKVYDASGRVIRSMMINDSSAFVSTEGLASGTYFFEFKAEGTIITKRIVVLHE